MIDNFKANRGLYAAIGKTLQPVAESDEQAELFGAAGHPHNDDPDFHTIHQKSYLVVGKTVPREGGSHAYQEVARHLIGEQVHRRGAGESANDFDSRVSNHIEGSHASYQEHRDAGAGQQDNGLSGEGTGHLWDGIRDLHAENDLPHGSWAVSPSLETEHFLAPMGTDHRDVNWHRSVPMHSGITTHVEHHFRIVK